MIKVLQKIQSYISQAQVDYRQIIYEESLKFYNNKREQHMQQMKEVIEDLQSDKANQPLIQFIRLIIDGCKFYRCEQMFRAASVRIVQVLKQTLSSIQQMMRAQEGQFYRVSAQFNSTLIKSSRHKDIQWLNMFKSYKELVKIDILAYFFYYNREYKEKSFFEIPIWNAEELSSFFQISGKYIFKLYRYYQDCSNLMTTSHNHKLDNLIAVLSLAKFKVRVYNVKRKRNEQRTELYKNKAWKFDKTEEDLTSSTAKTNIMTYSFSFCQIAIFARQKQMEMIPIVRKQHVEKQINNIISSSSEVEKKQQILIFKMQFHLPFNVIEKVLSNIAEKKANDTIYFEQELQKDLSVLEQKIQRVFSFELFPMKAIKTLSLDKEYKTNITCNFNITQWRSDVLACFVKANIRMFQKYYELTDIQLQLEEFVEPIMNINKFYFSYHDLVDFKDKNSQKDLVLTLILGMQDKKIIFYETKRQKEQNDTYLDSLTKILEQRVEKLPHAIVLFDDQRTKPFKWTRFCSFVNFIRTKYRSKTYTCYQSSRSKRSVKLFVYISTFLKLLSSMFTREHFFIYAEQYIKKIVKLHSQMIK